MLVSRARNKLRKHGYETLDPVPSSSSYIRGQEIWIDKREGGTSISFFTQGDKIDGAFKVHGREPDQPQFDYWASIFTRNLSEAIRLSRS